MNTKHSILAAALGLGLGLAAVASADTTTTIVFTGSTAFRSATHTAILASLTGETYAYSGTTGLGNANFAIFTEVTGTSPNQNTVIIKTAWSGSAAGIRDVAQGSTVKCIPNSQTQSTTGVDGVSLTSGAPTGAENLVPDVAMSDVFQASTIYTTPLLTDNKVAVVPFTWVANDGAPDSLDTVSPLLARALFSNGKIPLSMFTGDPAHRTSFAYATGRDPESGTRITAAAESGQGVFSAAVHYQPTLDTNNADLVASHQVWPQQTTPTFYDFGNNGYTSGGTLAGIMQAKSFAAVNGYYVSYLGISDATSTASVNGGVKLLKWNGVAYSQDGVKDGKYSFWGYQHLFHRSTLANPALAKVNAIRDSIVGAVAAPNVKLVDMKVSRISDGTLIGSTLDD